MPYHPFHRDQPLGRAIDGFGQASVYDGTHIVLIHTEPESGSRNHYVDGPRAPVPEYALPIYARQVTATSKSHAAKSHATQGAEITHSRARAASDTGLAVAAGNERLRGLEPSVQVLVVPN